MKNLNVGILVLVLALFSVNSVQAELKIGYVNSQQIMSEWQKARNAQQQLQERNQELQRELQTKMQKLDSMSQAFQQQQSMMDEATRKQKQQEIMQYQQEVQQFRQNNLGQNGKIRELRQQLIQPIMNQINQVIRNIANNENYDYILDASTGNVLYSKSAYNITSQVLRELESTDNN